MNWCVAMGSLPGRYRRVAPLRHPALEAELLDTSPLTAVLQDRVPRLSWFDQMLTVENVELSSSFRLEGPEIRLEDLEIQGGAKDRLELFAEFAAFNAAAMAAEQDA